MSKAPRRTFASPWTAFVGCVQMASIAASAGTPVTWEAALSGQWTDGANWSIAPEYPRNGTPADATYSVTINAVGAPYTVTGVGSNQSVEVESLVVDSADATLALTGGLFMAGSAEIRNGVCRMDGATLSGGTWTAPGGRFVIGRGSTIAGGATLGGDLALTGADLTFASGGSWTGPSAALGLGGFLVIADSRMLVDKDIHLNGGGLFVGGSPRTEAIVTLTLAPTSVVHGKGECVGRASPPQRNVLENLGQISANVPSATLSLSWDEMINDGVLEADGVRATLAIFRRWDSSGTVINRSVIRAVNGGVVEISPPHAGAFSNPSGEIIVADALSTVRLGGRVGSADIGAIDNTAGGTFELSGIVENEFGTLTLDAATGSMILGANAEIRGGRITPGPGGERLIPRGGRLVGRAFYDGDLFLGPNEILFLEDGASWTGPVAILEDGARLDIAYSDSLAGREIQLRGGTLRAGGPNLNVGGDSLAHGFGEVSGTQVVNDGTIRADVPGDSLAISLIAFINNGALEALGEHAHLHLFTSDRTVNNGVLRAVEGGIIEIMPDNPTRSFSNSAGRIVVEDENSIVRIGGSLGSADLGSLENVAGGLLQFTGRIDNRGKTLPTPAMAGTISIGRDAVIHGGMIEHVPDGGRLRFDGAWLLGGATYTGDLVLSPGEELVLDQGAAWSGAKATIGLDAILTFADSRTFAEQTIRLDGGSLVVGHPVATLTLGAAALLHGSGIVDDADGTLVNRGVVSADQTGGTLVIDVRNITNENVLEANGSTLLVRGSSPVNQGVVVARNGGVVILGFSMPEGSLGRVIVADASSTARLRGAFATADLAEVDNSSGGTLELMAQINNQGDAIALDGRTGSIDLGGSTIAGGLLIPGPNGQRFRFRGCWLRDGAVLTGDVALEGDDDLFLDTGGDWSGVHAHVGSSAVLGIADTRTISGKDIALREGNLRVGYLIGSERSPVVTLGDDSALHGSGSIRAEIEYSASRKAPTLVNAGTISANIEDRAIRIGFDSGRPPRSLLLHNKGLLEAVNGGELAIDTTIRNEGTIRFLDGRLTVPDEGARPRVYQYEGGAVQGTGGTDVDFTIEGGTLATGSTPGLSAGDILFSGDFVLSGGTILVDIGGREQGVDYDLFKWGWRRAIDLSGAKLSVRFFDGFERAVTPDDDFTILKTLSTLTGMFANVEAGGRVATADGYGDFAIELAEDGKSVMLRDFRSFGGPGSAIADWRMEHFGTVENIGDAADREDPDGDLVPNLVECAADRDPTDADGVNGMAGILAVIVAPADEPRVVLNLPTDPPRDVTLQLEGLGTSGWRPIATRQLVTGWTGPASPVDMPLDPPEAGRSGFGFVLPSSATFEGGVLVRLRAWAP